MKAVSRTRWMALFAGAAIAAAAGAAPADYYGTAEPFASEAVYFVLTDRFVNGDPANDHRDQGGANHSFDRPLMGANGVPDNIGYLGGDFKGILDNAEYIRAMGFTAVWITPIVDNPDEAFTGGNRIGEGFFADRGKTGYHGYWGVNFYRVDEHLESEGLRFADFTRRMQCRARPQDRARHRLQPRLAVVHDAGGPAEVRRDLRRRRDACGRITRTCGRNSSTRRTRCTAGFTASRTSPSSPTSTTRTPR